MPWFASTAMASLISKLGGMSKSTGLFFSTIWKSNSSFGTELQSMTYSSRNIFLLPNISSSFGIINISIKSKDKTLDLMIPTRSWRSLCQIFLGTITVPIRSFQNTRLKILKLKEKERKTKMILIQEKAIILMEDNMQEIGQKLSMVWKKGT